MSVKVSQKFQVVIPEDVRASLGIKPGMQVEVIAKGKVAYIVPIRSLKDLQQDLRGKLDTDSVREKSDRAV
jgi:AbrB family looped-hinge helix DNA binding protein